MSSQYNLALKATLDTSQVQQELQKLRNAQIAASEQTSGANGGTAAGNVAALDVKKLTTAIAKLDQTIAGLQKSLKNGVSLSQSKVSPSAGGGGGWLPIGGLPDKVNWKKWLQSPEYKRLNELTLRTIASGGLTPQEMQVMYARFGGPQNPMFAHNMLTAHPTFLGNIDYEKQVLRFQQSQSKMASQQMKQMREQAKFMRGFGTLFGGQMLGDIGGMIGGQTGDVISTIGSGLQHGGGAAMTATMLGAGAAAAPIGIVAGLATVFTHLYSSAQQASAALEKMAGQIQEAYDTAHKVTEKNQEKIVEARHQANADLLERSGNIPEARNLAKWWTENADSLKKQMLDIDPMAEERKIKEQAAARKAAVDRALKEGDVSWLDNDLANFMFHATGNMSVEDQRKAAYNKIDTEALEQIAASQNRFNKIESQMQSAERIAAMYQNVVDADKAKQEKSVAQSAAEVAKRIQLNEANDSTIYGYKQQAEMNKTQAFANSILDNKGLGPLEKFNKIVEQLDAARSSKNSALSEAFGISKYIKENEGKLDSTELQAKLRKQAQFEKDASSQAAIIGILENALANISTSTLAPDLSHVTSLAQYGFNMGEKDDTVERMDKYYTRSLNLQQQIKDKLQEGITTEATYSE